MLQIHEYFRRFTVALSAQAASTPAPPSLGGSAVESLDQGMPCTAQSRGFFGACRGAAAFLRPRLAPTSL